jgi:hypothetical protein
MFNKKITAILTIAVTSFVMTTSCTQDSGEQAKSAEKQFLKCLLKGAIAGFGISALHAYELSDFDKADPLTHKYYFRKADNSITLAVISGLAAENIKPDDTSSVPAFVKDITDAECKSLINYLGLLSGSLIASSAGNSLGSSLHYSAHYNKEKHIE